MTIKELSDLCGLTHDGGDDTRLFYDEEHITVRADKMTKKEYIKMENDLRDKHFKGKGFIVYAWNDVSGYNYWKKEGKDSGHSNYIMITADITNVDKVSPELLKKKIREYFDYFYKYNNGE